MCIRISHILAGQAATEVVHTHCLIHISVANASCVIIARIVGCAVGNDMSSRDIEGENPLYLPQAKVYDESCALGPWITLAQAMPSLEQTSILLTVTRNGRVAFQGETKASELARTPESLVEWLGRDHTFRHGAVLLTGTGVVPDKDFTLLPDDVVSITIAGIGTLTNSVVQRK